ncbi:MAG: Cobalt-zinc-cadmium resistance protein CzcA [Lentisphaerae bacterium ADurb.Bin242]|nr:MAG: Cobalt-zinc-cadmium resistance protein CzcA [Lentisphaerae bacterium ADurb.Bin242]
MTNMIRAILQVKYLIVIGMLAVIGYGMYCYREIPRDAFPDISPVMVPIFAETDGLAAEEVELMVIQPIESAMGGLPGVTQIKSTSAFGMGVVYVYFKDSVNMYFARQLVAERLSTAESLLPPGIPKPEMGPISTGLGQIFIYYLQADPKAVDTQGKELNSYLREINDFIVKRQLQTIQGVTEILSMGGHVLQYQIQLNPVEMRRYDVTFQEIVETVQANNRNVGGQYVEIGAEEYLIRGIGMLKNLDDIRNLTLKEKDGVPIRLERVARVQYGPDIRRGVVTKNGEEEVVAGIVLKLYGENTSKVIARLHERLKSVQATLPRGVTIVPYYDQANLVDNAGQTVADALWQGILLVVIVLALAFWNLRASLIVALAMPFCAAIAVICLWWSGQSTNLMSLGGIAIALGMLVDGSIVVTENIMRNLGDPQNAGKDRLAIIIDSVAVMIRPVAFALLIIIAVFIPIFMFEGVEGKMFRPLAFTITIALGASIVAAFLNSTALGAILLKPSGKNERRTEKTLAFIRKIYMPFVVLAIQFRYLVFAVVLAALVVSIFMLGKIGREFIPTLEEGTIMVAVTMAPSIGLGESEAITRKLEKIILRHPEVTGTISRIGRPEAGSHPHPVNVAEIQVALKLQNGKIVGAEGRLKIIEALRRELGDFPGVTVSFSQPIQNVFDELLSGAKTYFSLKVYGENTTVLRTKAEEIREAVSKIPGVVDLSTEQSFGQPQIQIELNHPVMSRLGVNGAEIMSVVESALGGENIGTIYQDTRKYNINMRLAEPFRKSPEAIGNLKFKSASGRYVDLNQVANIKITEGPVQINRENIQRVWTIFGNIAGRAPSDIVADMRKVIASQVELPPGYSIEFGGQFENQERAMARLMFVVPVVIGLIFILLWLAFDSLRNSLTVMVNVPLALIGGVFGLLAMNQLLSIPAAVGFIALFGIAIQNAVVMVTDFNELRAEGKPLYEAVLACSVRRFRAIILTSLTTLLGLLPLLLSNGIGAEVQRPLAIIVIFGLGSSTLLTLFFLPALYYEVERRFEKKVSRQN